MAKKRARPIGAFSTTMVLEEGEPGIFDSDFKSAIPDSQKVVRANITQTVGPNKKRMILVQYTEMGSVATNPPLTFKQASKIAADYTSKAKKRLAMFLYECRRSKKKIDEILAMVASSGYIINSFALSEETVPEHLKNKRKRVRAVQFDITATREGMTLTGYLLVKPCTVNLFLAATSIAWDEPVVYCRYYRNLVYRDNYLAALVKGVPINDFRSLFSRRFNI